MLNRNDISILYALYKNQCTSEIRSFTIKKIEDHVKQSNTRIRYTIRSLLMAEYIGEGCKAGNATTYYITQKGIELLKGVSS